MRIVKTACWALTGLGMLTVSCVRDNIPDCPPLRINIAVKDKNYFNVDKVELEDRLDEDLAFREYVPTLYWVLRDADTGKIVDKSPLITVSGDEKTVSPDINPDLPHGKYVLTVWGGLENSDPLNEDMTLLGFHPGNTEGRDVYMTNDTLLYDAWHNDYTVEMERTKGKLIIEKLDLPADIKESKKSITGLFSNVNNEFLYGGETGVSKQTALTPAPQIVTKTLLSPSLKEDGSVLSLDFTGNGAALKPKEITITMRRNELTVLRYVWVPEEQTFEIYMLVNDNWETITKMDID